MPKIPTHRRQQIPSGRVPEVSIPYDIADVGAGLEAKGLGVLGKGIGNLGQALFQIEQAEGISQASTAKGQADSRIELLREDLKNNNDPNTYQAALEEALLEMNDFRPENSIGAKRFNDYIEQSTPGWESGVEVLKIQKQQALIEAAYISDRSKAIALGYLDEANRLTIEARDETGAITPQQAAKDLASAPAMVIKSVVTSLLNNANRFSTNGEWGQASVAIEQAQKILDSAGGSIDPETERLLRNRIRVMREAKVSKQQAASEAYVNETHKLTMDALSQDITDLSSIDKLPVNLKVYWEKKLVDRDKMVKAEKGDPFVNVYDPARYNSFRTIMEQDPKNLKESQIIDSVGYGLTLDQGIDLVERHRKLSRKDSPLRAPEAARATKRITNAFEGGIIKHPDFIEGAVPGSEDEYRNSVLRDQMIDELEEWLEERPRTPEEIIKRTSETLAPYEEMEARGFMNQIFHNIFSRESWVFSTKDYRDAIKSLNKEAQVEWEHQRAGGPRHKFWGGILPEDFISKWQSPHKILTPQIAQIYLKWEHGNSEDAKARAAKDGWREPK